jgi:predicted nucleic acid-binding protein
VIIFDTDALSHLQKRNSVGLLIENGLDTSPDRDIRITTVTAYEMLGGAVALVDRRKKERGDLISAFHLLEELFKFLENWKDLILPYNAKAEQIYQVFPPRLRQELKDNARIAAIALVYGAAVWTCNVVDYARVPDLTLFDAKAGSKVS